MDKLPEYTCCSLNCPLILYCSKYNVEIDRGPECKHYKEIEGRVLKRIKEQKAKERRKKHEETYVNPRASEKDVRCAIERK